MDEHGIQQGLEHDAQWIEERMPKNVTKKEAAQIAQRLRDFMMKHKKTQSAIAKACGINPSYVSQIVNERFESKMDFSEAAKKIINYIDSFERKFRRKKTVGSYVKTEVAKRIGMVVKQTEAFSDDNEAKIGFIIGDAGHGKSLCLREYAKANRNSIYVPLDATMTSTAIFAAIAEALKKDTSGTLKTLSARLIKELKEWNMVVMLDEASSLNVHKLDQLRQIITVRCKCPLIIAGNNHLLNTINQSAAKRGYESLDQFRSRVICTANLDKLAATPGGGLYNAEEIRRLYEYGGIKLTRDAVESLKKICSMELSGRLRTCSHIVSAIHLSPMFGRGKSIDALIIRSVIEQLGLQISDEIKVGIKEIITETKEQVVAAKAG